MLQQHQEMVQKGGGSSRTFPNNGQNGTQNVYTNLYYGGGGEVYAGGGNGGKGGGGSGVVILLYK